MTAVSFVTSFSGGGSLQQNVSIPDNRTAMRNSVFILCLNDQRSGSMSAGRVDCNPSAMIRLDAHFGRNETINSAACAGSMLMNSESGRTPSCGAMASKTSDVRASSLPSIMVSKPSIFRSRTMKYAAPIKVCGANVYQRTSKRWRPLPGAPVRLRVKGSNHGSISDSRRGSGLSSRALFALLGWVPGRDLSGTEALLVLANRGSECIIRLIVQPVLGLVALVVYGKDCPSLTTLVPGRIGKLRMMDLKMGIHGMPAVLRQTLPRLGC